MDVKMLGVACSLSFKATRGARNAMDNRTCDDSHKIIWPRWAIWGQESLGGGGGGGKMQNADGKGGGKKKNSS